ncbi:HalOD1 output domain-containing protein [Halomicrobium zhouii]|nr:HalOD1 output domain-containing protein [Halomicrobium zhouii]
MERPVDRVLAAVAAAEETDLLSLQPPLGDVVDADALNALVSGSQDRAGADVTVQFTYRGHDVTVGPDGDVELQ